MEDNKIGYGLLWNNQIIPNHGSAISVEGPTPGPDWVGRVSYLLVTTETETGRKSLKAEINFPWRRIK